jgi:hypothetical protein
MGKCLIKDDFTFNGNDFICPVNMEEAHSSAFALFLDSSMKIFVGCEMEEDIKICYLKKD